jgi:hypothetical protein
MFVIPKKKSEKIISFDDNYISLKNINEKGDLEFAITYKVNQKIVVNKNINKVKVTLYINENASQKIDLASPPVNKTNNSITAESMMQNILFMNQQYLQHTEKYKQSIVTEVISDVTTSISNTSIAQLKKGVTETKNIKVMVPINIGGVSPVMGNNRVLTVEQQNADLRKYLLNLLIKENFDPSDLVLVHNSDYISSVKNISGIFSVKKDKKLRGRSWLDNGRIDNKNVTKAAIVTNTNEKSKTSQLSDNNDYHVSITPQDTQDIKVTCSFLIKKEDINKFSFLSLEKAKLKFSVLDTKSISLDDVEKDVNIYEYYKRYITPKIAPIVNFFSFESNNKAILQITQQDKTANSVALYQKKISISKVGNVYEPYSFIGVYRLKQFETDNVPIQISENVINIIRVIPIYSEGFDTQSYYGNDFTNIVINNNRKNKEFNNVSIVSKITSSGVMIEVRDIPNNVVSFLIKKRNMTLFEKDYSIVDGELNFVNTNKKHEMFSIGDKNVKDGYIYEYSCEVIYRDGKKDICGVTYIEYIPLVKNLVSTKIENLKTFTNEDNLDVSFQIITNKLDTHHSSVEKLLKQDEKQDFYKDELSQSKKDFNGLLAWKITRINLTEGKKEEIGVITDPNFVESKYRNINSLEPLKNGHNYRYEVNTLSRNPDTMFPDNRVEYINPVTKLKHHYYPYKFLHPITLKHGNLVSKNSIKFHYPKEEMEFGRIGDIEYIDVGFELPKTSVIEDILVEKFDNEYVYVSWKYLNDIKNVDFFMVLLLEHDAKRIIGKVQANSNKNRHQFIHVLERNEMGNYRYIIIPFMNDFTMGKEYISNPILVK